MKAEVGGWLSEKIARENPSYFKDPKNPTPQEVAKLLQEKPDVRRQVEAYGIGVLLFIGFLIYQALK